VTRAGVQRRASGSWQKLRTARTAKKQPTLVEVPPGALPRHEAARRFWSMRTWSEYAAVPAVSQVVLALVRHGAPLETLGAYTAIADDELRHALLSRDLAERLGGYVDEVPDGLGYSPRALARPSDVPVHVWALANGCFSETVSLALIAARQAKTTQPVVRAVLNETLRDEALHVRVAWELAGELLPELAEPERRELKSYGAELGQMLRSTFGTQALPAVARRRERKLRDETAKAGLGALSADEENALVDHALAEIDARLAGLLP
jgi:hypothetical protein